MRWQLSSRWGAAVGASTQGHDELESKEGGEGRQLHDEGSFTMRRWSYKKWAIHWPSSFLEVSAVSV
jgi:hypothetical protein